MADANYSREYRARNAERVKAVQRAWRLANAEYKRQKNAAWREANRDRLRVSNAKYRQSNPAKRAAWHAKRRAAKIHATPAWANAFFIEEAYDVAQRRTKVTGIEWHVDHIVPLQSKFVCGLHVEANLRVVPGAVNLRKKNRWPVDCDIHNDR